LSRCQPITTPTVIFGARHLSDLRRRRAKDPDFQSADQAREGSALPAATAAARNRSGSRTTPPAICPQRSRTETAGCSSNAETLLISRARGPAGWNSATYWNPFGTPVACEKRASCSVRPASSNRGCDSPNMGTEATNQTRTASVRFSGYHFFLLAGGTLPVAADCRLRKWGHVRRKPCTV
jgi:hypothetical protein